MQKINIAILGASGYTARSSSVSCSPTRMRISQRSSAIRRQASHWAKYIRICVFRFADLVSMEQVDFSGIDLVFCCLPHGTTQKVIAGLPKHLKVIDLSADFRLENPATYAQWYGNEHQAVELQKEAVYGLTEHARDAVKKARLVSQSRMLSHQCATAAHPASQRKLISPDGIIIDAKSGMTGAGRGAQQNHLYTEISEGISAYSLGAHRHAPEIEQGLGAAAGKELIVSFTPHLMPMNRGILSTIYVKTSKDVATLKTALEMAYANEPFVHVMPDKFRVFTHSVRGTNHCVMNVFADRVPGQVIIVSAIDNLVKRRVRAGRSKYERDVWLPGNLIAGTKRRFPLNLRHETDHP